MFRSRSHVAAIAFAMAVTLFTACSTDTPTAPPGGALAGLKATTGSDSGTNNQGNTGPGYFHGTVLGESPIGSGNDSLASAPRIANVTVTIYQDLRVADAPTVGPVMGSVVTGADGLFTLPTLPAGSYIVTFVPPAGSPYHGVYAFGWLSAVSSTYPWWVVLSKH